MIFSNPGKYKEKKRTVQGKTQCTRDYCSREKKSLDSQRKVIRPEQVVKVEHAKFWHRVSPGQIAASALLFQQPLLRCSSSTALLCDGALLSCCSLSWYSSVLLLFVLVLFSAGDLMLACFPGALLHGSSLAWHSWRNTVRKALCWSYLRWHGYLKLSLDFSIFCGFNNMYHFNLKTARQYISGLLLYRKWRMLKKL